MKITIVLPKGKHRAHLALFVKDTPFKPKVVESKKGFKRHKKHKGKDTE
jgi:hypothetical protein